MLLVSNIFISMLQIFIQYLSRLWSASPSFSNYSLYEDFVMAVANTTYENLHNLQRFSATTFFNDAHFLKIAREMNKFTVANQYLTTVITEVSSAEVFKLQKLAQ